LGKKSATRGKKVLLDEFFEQVADARITWGDLLFKLSVALGINSELDRLQQSIIGIDPSLSRIRSPDPSPVKTPPTRDLVKIQSSRTTFCPKTLVRFCVDFVEALGPDFTSVPSQSGNSPHGIAVEKPEWAGWFCDSFDTRLKLAFDEPRRLLEPSYLTFILLWCFGMCEKAERW
jgi:hypothetical protein